MEAECKEEWKAEYEGIGCKTYCKFCGKEIKPKTSIEDYDEYIEYFCSCEGTENIQKIELLNNRQKELKKSADLILNPLRCDEEISNIKSKYHQK